MAQFCYQKSHRLVTGSLLIIETLNSHSFVAISEDETPGLYRGIIILIPQTDKREGADIRTRLAIASRRYDMFV